MRPYGQNKAGFKNILVSFFSIFSQIYFNGTLWSFNKVVGVFRKQLEESLKKRNRFFILY